MLGRAAQPQPTQTPLWLLAWWDTFGRSGGRELRVVVVEDAAGEVVGILPLLRRWVMRGGVIPVATLELLGTGEDLDDEIFSEYLGAIVARGFEGAVAAELAETLSGGRVGAWDELHLRAMRGDDPTIAPLVGELHERAIEAELRVTHECPYIVLPATWEGYVGALDSSRRYFVRRTLRDLDAWAGKGGAVLRRAGNPAELARGWSILQALHAERWEGGGVFHSARFRQFHEAVMPALLRGEGGSLDLLWLEIAGEPVAATYSIVHAGDVHFYQSGRKLDVPRQARPGIAMHLLAIRRAIEQGHRTYDFLARADPYKQKLAPACSRSLVALSAVAPTVRARASSEVRRKVRLLVGMARDFAARNLPLPSPPAPPPEPGEGE